MVKVARGTETGEAPGWQGATRENTGLYVTEEQCWRAGCLAGRMQRDFHHGLLAVVRESRRVEGQKQPPHEGSARVIAPHGEREAPGIPRAARVPLPLGDLSEKLEAVE